MQHFFSQSVYFTKKLREEINPLTMVTLKPDFHSRFSLVANEILRMGHAQSGETNRTGRKMSFVLFAFEIQIFQLPRNFLTAKPIRLLS